MSTATEIAIMVEEREKRYRRNFMNDWDGWGMNPSQSRQHQEQQKRLYEIQRKRELEMEQRSIAQLYGLPGSMTTLPINGPSWMGVDVACGGGGSSGSVSVSDLMQMVAVSTPSPKTKAKNRKLLLLTV